MLQLANILLDLGGDSGNQVPKYGVTAAEIAVLNAVHGDGSVHDITPTGEMHRSHRDERARLLSIYGRVQDGRDTSPVSLLFPGAAARVFERLDELDLPEEMFKAKTRVSANEQPAAAKAEENAARLTSAQRRAALAVAKQAAKDAAVSAAQLVATEAAAKATEAAAAAQAAETAAEQPVEEEPEAEEHDGIGDMADQPDAFK